SLSQGAPCSQAIRANGLVFVSGQLALRPDHAEIVSDDIGEQTEQVFDNLQAILEEAGSSLDPLVKTTGFLTAPGPPQRRPAGPSTDSSRRPSSSPTSATSPG